MYGREGQISERWWQSNEYSAGAGGKFVFSYIKILQCRHFVVLACTYILVYKNSFRIKRDLRMASRKSIETSNSNSTP